MLVTLHTNSLQHAQNTSEHELIWVVAHPVWWQSRVCDVRRVPHWNGTAVPMQLHGVGYTRVSTRLAATRHTLSKCSRSLLLTPCMSAGLRCTHEWDKNATPVTTANTSFATQPDSMVTCFSVAWAKGCVLSMMEPPRSPLKACMSL